jgi:DNA-binding transcriptional ArsR family regulator
MVTQPARQTANVFGAVADPTRRAILDLSRRRELSAGELAERFPVSRPAVSRHLRVLRGADLVQETRVAQSRIYSLNPAPLMQVDRWLNGYCTFWRARLHDLERYVESKESR